MANSKVVKAVVVDDHPLFRRGVVELLNESAQFEVIKSFGSAEELLKSLPTPPPDLILLDLQMPKITGVDALKKLRPQWVETKFVILTFSMDSKNLMDAISYGVDGFLLKDSSSEQILSQLISVMQGKITINESGITLLAETIRTQGIPSEKSSLSDNSTKQNTIFDDLTEREKQTLELISKGLSNKLIARELGISDGTVKVYVKSLLRKLELNSRLELAAWSHTHHAFSSDENA
ncbi:response regulator [Thiomicrorhabdus indica]|uniref:response regulator n=1 Tax=Thiomicrorhabdus indica TaxID=2267253 RepID=UPI00102DB087|nr:response regulator [Thiomicrorhabdus indica]